jgi:hypothetical protein
MPQGMLISRRSAIVAGIVTLLIFLGCMSFEGTHVDHTEILPPLEIPNPNLVPDGLQEQEGRGTISGRSELDVYYPVPFFGPPNLELQGDPEDVKLMYQRRDHFRIKNVSDNTHYVASFSWKARGVKALIAAPPTPGPTATVPPPRTLPSEPLPVSQP